MGVNIKRKAAPEAAEGPTEARSEKSYPREGVHLRASPWERQKAHGYEGAQTAALCNLKNERADMTYLARKVTCPCCIAYIVDRLGIPEYLTVTQWGIIDRPAPEGAPTEDEPYRGINTSKGYEPHPARKPMHVSTKNAPARAREPEAQKPSIYSEF